MKRKKKKPKLSQDALNRLQSISQIHAARTIQAAISQRRINKKLEAEKYFFLDIPDEEMPKYDYNAIMAARMIQADALSTSKDIGSSESYALTKQGAQRLKLRQEQQEEYLGPDLDIDLPGNYVDLTKGHEELSTPPDSETTQLEDIYSIKNALSQKLGEEKAARAVKAMLEIQARYKEGNRFSEDDNDNQVDWKYDPVKKLINETY